MHIQTQLSDAHSLTLSVFLMYAHIFMLSCCMLEFPPSPTFASSPASGEEKKMVEKGSAPSQPPPIPGRREEELNRNLYESFHPTDLPKFDHVLESPGESF